jgi:glutathione transport system ATP-binding protein
MSHRIGVMYLGQLVEIGPAKAILGCPQHPYTKRLLAAVPVPDPARRHLRRPIDTTEIASPVRALDDPPPTPPLLPVADGHFVQIT